MELFRPFRLSAEVYLCGQAYERNDPVLRLVDLHTPSRRETAMKRILVAALALAAWASSGPVEAKGCLKGAAVGGVAGHMAGHGALGAAAGCVVGRHRANNQAKQQPNNQAPAQQPPR